METGTTARSMGAGAGCGAGRFAEVALLAGAKVVALDYSSAVDVCYANLKHHPNLYVVQGDIFAIPFVPETFPFVYSLAVLQHTPDVAKAFFALTLLVSKGRALVRRLLLESVQDDAACEIFISATDQTDGSAQVIPLASTYYPDFIVDQPGLETRASGWARLATHCARVRLHRHISAKRTAVK